MFKQMKLESHKDLFCQLLMEIETQVQSEKENFISNKPTLLEGSWHLSSVTILPFCSKGVFYMNIFSSDNFFISDRWVPRLSIVLKNRCF